MKVTGYTKILVYGVRSKYDTEELVVNFPADVTSIDGLLVVAKGFAERAAKGREYSMISTTITIIHEEGDQ